jgi:hypothetical protein
MKLFEIQNPHIGKKITPYRPWMLDTYDAVEKFFEETLLLSSSFYKINPRSLHTIISQGELIIKNVSQSEVNLDQNEVSADDFFINDGGVEKFRVKITHAGRLSFLKVSFENFVGFPDEMTRLFLSRCNFKSWEEFPATISDGFDIRLGNANYPAFDIADSFVKGMRIVGAYANSSLDVKGLPESLVSLKLFADNINIKNLKKFDHLQSFSFAAKNPVNLLSALLCVRLWEIYLDKTSSFFDSSGPKIKNMEAAVKIINNYIRSADGEVGDILECKTELIENGLGAYAKL